VRDLFIELDDDTSARGLHAELRGRGFDAEHADGAPTVAVAVVDSDPGRRLERVLSSVEAWLGEAGARGAIVHIDGTCYRLQPPPSRRTPGSTVRPSTPPPTRSC
jgi:hypothetical protein